MWLRRRSRESLGSFHEFLNESVLELFDFGPPSELFPSTLELSPKKRDFASELFN
jgi:hypothetical protein